MHDVAPNGRTSQTSVLLNSEKSVVTVNLDGQLQVTLT
jgi:hypothetical protein